MKIPIWQPMLKCEENTSEMFVVQKELFLMAARGELLIENNHFVGVLADRLRIQGKPRLLQCVHFYPHFFITPDVFQLQIYFIEQDC